MRILFCFLMLAHAANAADVPEIKALEFRIVEEEKTANSQEHTLRETRNKEVNEEKIYLNTESLLPKLPIERAYAEPNLQSGDYQISIQLTDEAGKKMAEVSRKYLNRRIALLVDGRVISAPKMFAEIPGGQLKITGNYSEEEALQLAKRINNSGRKAQP